MYLCSILWIIVLVFTVISVFTQKNHTVALQRVQERVQENEKNNKKKQATSLCTTLDEFYCKMFSQILIFGAFST